MQPRVCYRFWSGKTGGWEWRRNPAFASACSSGRRSRRLEEACWVRHARATIWGHERITVQRYQKICEGFRSDYRVGGTASLRSETSITTFVRGWVSFVINNLTCEGKYACRTGHTHMWLDVYPRCIWTFEATCRCLGWHEHVRLERGISGWTCERSWISCHVF